jgi:pimeloyl-ACP methyl ester carboxylesterase
VVHVLGAPIHFWEYGDAAGEAIVLVHGFRGDHHGLEGIAVRIAALGEARGRTMRVIVPDLPGFGQSGPIAGHEHTLDTFAEWLREFSALVAPGHTSVLGHSFGSLIVSAAIKGGLSPARLVLINPITTPALEGPHRIMTQAAIAYYRLADALPERAGNALLAHPVIVRLMSETMAKSRDPILRSFIHDQHDRYFSIFADKRTLLESFRASVSHTVGEFSDTFTMPTLLIAGDRDDLTPLSSQLGLQRRVPGSRLKISPGVGHLVHYEAPGDAAAWIADFLQSTDTALDAQGGQNT